MVKIKILKGNKKNCVKEISEDDALRLSELGEVEILDDVAKACAGTTQSGDPCSLAPKEGEDYCWRHKKEA